MEFDEALKTAEEFIAAVNGEGGEPVALMPDQTRILPYGWVFFYQSKRFIASGDPRDGVAGNAPLLVTRTGESHVLGTARSLDDYLREFERSGSPHPLPGRRSVSGADHGLASGLAEGEYDPDDPRRDRDGPGRGQVDHR
ncbi:YrhB domain-containing protein [Longimicrobium sp.]|uniref:YrhB domain-containing protein n=1 Tax=Longimicrobium sp. TaxID=2029185 RepID=UPI0039C8FC4F